jgi:hypothetical protein
VADEREAHGSPAEIARRESQGRRVSLKSRTTGELVEREEHWVLRTRGFRFGVFVVLLALFAAFLVTGHYADELQICHDALPTVGNEGIVEQCGAPSFGDFWPLLLLVFSPLLPDIGSLSIAGFLDMSRRLSRAERRQDELSESAEETEALSEESLALAVRTVLDAAGTELPRKEERYLGSEPGFLPSLKPSTETRALSVPELESQLIRTWSVNLEPPFEIGQQLRRRPDFYDDFYVALRMPPGPERAGFISRWPRRLRELADRLPEKLLADNVDAYERWLELFDRELRAVRATRNAVAHPPHDLTSDQIAEAVAVADRLTELLRTGLRAEQRG